MAKANTVGTMAVLALAGGIAYRTGQSPPAPPSSPASSGAPAAVIQTRAHSSATLDHRSEGPCLTIRDFLYHEDSSPKEQSVSGHIRVNGGKGENVDLSFSGSQPEQAEATDCGEGRVAYMIALVADPVNSHLALTFDRTIESVVRGATTAGYSYVNYYFPWELNLSRDQPDLEKRRAQKDEKRRLERWPGLLLFRGKDDGTCDPNDNLYKDCPLAVFLVSETPAAGINRVEFQRAVSYISNGKMLWSQIPVVGPVFSGSADSMIQAIRDSSPNAFKVYNGSATSDERRDRIQEKLGLEGSSFTSFIHPDRLSFQKLLNKWSGKERIAILSEDGTSFGAQAAGWLKRHEVRPGVWSISFPREISQLRNATQPSAQVSPGVGAAPQLRQLLPLDLRDVISGHDSILNYSEQTPSSQEAVVTNIGRELREGSYRFIGVMASDPLDAIFLSRVVRDLRPDARLFSLDNDLLFVRATADSPLDGMLSVTTYPLFLANQRSNGSLLAFPNQISEALYNATVAILASYNNSAPEHDLLEYSPLKCAGLKETCGHAPIWITVLSRSGYWPVSMIATGAGGEKTGMASWSNGGRPREIFQPDRVWIALFLILSVLVSLYSWFVIQAHLASPKRMKRWKESFWSIPGEGGFAGRAAYLLAKTLTILATYCILTAPFWKLCWSRSTIWLIANMVSILIIGFLLAAALVPFIRWRKRSHAAAINLTQFPKDTHAGLALVVVLFAAGCLVAWYTIIFRPGSNLEPFFLAWRSINLLSGVSPMLPLLFLSAGILWWSWMHFRRLLLLLGRTPALPEIDQAGMQFSFADLSESVKEAVEEPFFHWKWRVVIAMLILVLIFWDPRRLLQTIEGRTYEWMYGATLGLLASLIFLTFSRMLLIWERLKEFLEQLERHPLRQAFSKMPKDRVWSPVMQNAMKRSYLFEMRSLETARKLRHLKGGGPAIFVAEDMEFDLQEKLNQVAKRLRLTFQESKESYEKIKKVAEVVAWQYLAAVWRRGESLTLTELEKKSEAKTTDRQAPLTGEKEQETVAAEFVALPYLFFIRVKLLQIHNLLFFVIGGFVLVVFSIGSYPFQSPRVLGWFMAAAMVVLGYGVARIFAQMAKDSLLSRITDTAPGELDSGFYLKLISAGALPVISLILSQFPSVGRYLFSWLEPTLQALR